MAYPPPTSVSVDPDSGPNQETVAEATRVSPMLVPWDCEGASSTSVLPWAVPIAHTCVDDSASTSASEPEFPGVGLGTRLHPAPSKWATTPRIPSVPTAHTSSCANASTPYSASPGTGVTRLQ